MNDFKEQRRAAIASRVTPAIALSLIAALFLSIAMAGVGGIMIASTRTREADEQHFVYTWAQNEIGRDRTMIAFFCSDLAQDDLWRDELHAVDVKYRNHNDPIYIARDAIYRARHAHSALRSKECATMFQGNP